MESSLSPVHDLPCLCTLVMSSLWPQEEEGGGAESSSPWVEEAADLSRHRLWNVTRQLDFYTFCQKALGSLNISPSVIYTSLKYVQSYLASIPASEPPYGSERSIFMVALMLAYKFVEDYGSVSPHSWSAASRIPVHTLVKLEIDFLNQIDHMLHIDKSSFSRWVYECNSMYEKSYQELSTVAYQHYYYQCYYHQHDHYYYEHSPWSFWYTYPSDYYYNANADRTFFQTAPVGYAWMQ